MLQEQVEIIGLEPREAALDIPFHLIRSDGWTFGAQKELAAPMAYRVTDLHLAIAVLACGINEVNPFIEGCVQKLGARVRVNLRQLDSAKPYSRNH
jgi:hypothetical protein